MAENNNIELMQEMYAAFGRGDIDAILATVTEDVDWGTQSVATEIPWYRIRQGREGVADFFRTLATEIDFERFEPNLFAATGDQVLIRVDYTYRFKKNGKGAATTGIHQFTFRDGQVSQFRAYEDTASIRDAWNT